VRTDSGRESRKAPPVTGLSVDYIFEGDSGAIDGGAIPPDAAGGSGLTTGRLDTRFSGRKRSARAAGRLRSAITALGFGLRPHSTTTAATKLAYGAENSFQQPRFGTFRTWNFHTRPRGSAGLRPPGQHVMPASPIDETQPNLKVS